MAQYKSVRSSWIATASALVISASLTQVAVAQEAEPTAVDEIIVTAQKREQSIRDVPIAVSAFSAETLDAMKIEGGSELLRAIPNVTFSKSNFSMYNFAIRGVGTKALSAASDPAVAVSFNNTPLIRNRLFESEYLDVNRVEVLRGPQGTLYGRNATAGVVNMLPNIGGPEFEAYAKAEAGNYGSMRGQGMINIPLGDTFWIRAAGSITSRDGFDYNTFKDEDVNGRDLWQTRLTLGWEPSSRFRANLIWEHFEEDDDRLRTGKQLCTPAPNPAMVGSFAPTPETRGRFSQGCLPRSLYSDDAYGAPNAEGMAQIFMLTNITLGYLPLEPGEWFPVSIGAISGILNPYEGVTQSRNLREIATEYDPRYVATNDVVQLNMEFDISDGLRLYSQTAYAKDDFWSTQDYARYMSNEIFQSSDGLTDVLGNPMQSVLAPGGYYNDPQLGPSRRMLSVDLSRSDNRQFYQELRLQSAFDGNFNFSLGANYLDFKTQDDYFVFNNTFNYLAEWFYGQDLTAPLNEPRTTNCQDGSNGECIYIDRSSIDNLVGDGHNYFRSKNAVHTQSWAIFGEGYWNIDDNKRLTVGLRYTDDTKTTTPYPSQLLLGSDDTIGVGPTSGGTSVRDYPAWPDVKQNWQAVTGRAVFDWKPRDGLMVYASYARGYKGGGTNPPRAAIDPRIVQYQPLAETFEPEYVNAFEVGSKFLNQTGTFGLNVTAFFYDYTDYQVSQIVDRISLNENFDATSAGIEFEAVWRPTENFRMDANIGFLKTEIADGEKSIDVMNRTQGNADWVVLRPWVQVPSNCIAPVYMVDAIYNNMITNMLAPYALSALCGGSIRIGSFDPDFPAENPFFQFDQWTGTPYNPLVDAPNGGRGFDADLSGNELPNAPRWTVNIGAQYTWRFSNSDLTLRGDYYRQAESYFRVYNTEYDQLKGWDNVGVSLTWQSQASNMVVQAYVKNLFDDAPIVDAFTNSDDSMLTTNVFTLDPRVWGISIAKRF
ncbi:TonB-dependent receptor [uncultured Brevundimonas sp.]|uniref:TonB-dependent receptor n=1 Tax=uncultured Brevundimonas sp. TaxID=213418 RepID=UPI002604E7E3|nr:TonB-dependent receptor [uncultured Brevundimonas sp.]